MDVREAILARLVAIGRDNMVKVYRNVDQLPSEGNMPALLIFDADENAEENDPTERPANAPRRVTMTPAILLLATDASEDIGAQINGLRALIVNAIFGDATLLALTMNGEGIRYGGCRLDLYQGSGVQGHMHIDISFTYILRPDQLGA